MIHIRELHKTYRTGFFMTQREALRGIDLDVGEGEIYGFIGPNGAGKSTTIKILTGLLRPGTGKVELLGLHPSQAQARAQVGYLPEQPYFYDYLSGWELLRFFGRLSGLRGTDLDKRIHDSLALVQADKDWIHRRLRSYSKGMMQRVGLAQAVLSGPRLLILDEPMSGLDPIGRKDVREAILSLNRSGTTIFYSSHVLSDVEAVSHRVAMIVEGKIVRQGTVEEVTGSEAKDYHIRTLQDIAQSDLPAGILRQRPQDFLARTPELRDIMLRFCLEKDISVERLESRRASLEEVLAEEVARA